MLTPEVSGGEPRPESTNENRYRQQERNRNNNRFKFNAKVAQESVAKSIP